MSKLSIMQEAGARLGQIKGQVVSMVKAGVTPLEIDSLVDSEIKKFGDKPSFKMVPGYSHATCISVNDAIVHGIPTNVPLKPGDVVKVDLGLFHEGYHVDSGVTLVIQPASSEVQKFVATCQKALDLAISRAQVGSPVTAISEAMQTTVEAGGYSVIRDLTGHGVGKKLHEEPFIPCYVDPKNRRDILYVGQTIAIEVMAAMGDFHLVEAEDGWTLSTQDKSHTCMIEESVFVSETGPIILTTTKHQS